MAPLARTARLMLAAALVYACAERPPDDAFGVFWREFSGAVAGDSEAAVGALTAFPFLYENEAHDAAEFGRVYGGLFDVSVRACVERAQPVAEGSGYQVYCGPLILVFERQGGVWRFTEFAADPEAEEPAGEMEETTSPADVWRIAGSVAAPWAAPDEGSANPSMRGASVAFDSGRVSGPAPFACDGATYEFGVTPAEGLFQGNLPQPAQAGAAALGVTRLPALTLQVACDAGVYDYHFIARDTLVTALDGVVWRLTAEVLAGGPRQVVLELLLEHMSGDMAFTPALVHSKRRFFSPALTARIDSYFARPVPADEPPPIDGDPITDSQEYPTRFGFGEIEVGETNARVAVVFIREARTRVVVALLRRYEEAWLIDDLLYEDGRTFRQALEAE